MIDVLIVDDELWVAKLIQNLIDWASYGFRIVGSVNDGDEAIKKIEELKPQLVFTDIRMPGRSGLDLMKAVSTQTSRILFVIISGYNDFEYAKTALTFGAIGYLLKPIEEKELIEVLLKAKEFINQEEKQQNTNRSLKTEIEQTIEKLREEYFKNAFESKNIEKLSIAKMNSDLNLNFSPGRFRVAMLAFASRDNIAVALEETYKILWACGLPLLCLEMVVYADEMRIIMLLNYHASSEAKIQDCLKDLFDKIILKGYDAIMTKGVAVESADKLLLSHDDAQELIAFRLFYGNNNIYDANYLSGLQNNNIGKRLIDIKAEMQLRQALLNGEKSGALLAAERILDALKKQARENPLIFMRGIKLLLNLVGECCGLENAAKQEFISSKIKEAELISTIPEMNAMIYNIIDFYFGNKTEHISKNESLVNAAKKYIDSNYNQDIGLENVACAINLNANYLSEIFRKEAGINFKDYLAVKRIERAKEMLTDNAYKLNDIAKSVGYNDPKNFSKVFKKYVGMLPSEYRKLILGHV